MTARKTPPRPDVGATVDRITRNMLRQLELQTQAALNLLVHAPESQRAALLAEIAKVRGRLVRLRARILGPGRPELVARSPRKSGKTR